MCLTQRTLWVWLVWCWMPLTGSGWNASLREDMTTDMVKAQTEIHTEGFVCTRHCLPNLAFIVAREQVTILL